MKKTLWMAALVLAACSGRAQVVPSSGDEISDSRVAAAEQESDVVTDTVVVDECNMENVTQLNRLALQLMRLTLPPSGQVVSTAVSPLSISFLTGLLMEGAEGTTRTEMEQLTGLKRDEARRLFHKLAVNAATKDPSTEFLTGSYVAVNRRYPVLPAFSEMAKQLYQACVENLDFSSPRAVHTINQWCKTQTKGMIPQMVSQLDNSQLAVLLNTIYFKGSWAQKFRQTEQDRFVNADGRGVSLPMMHREGVFPYLRRATYALAILDYGTGDYSMVVLLPHDGHRPADILKSMTAQQWDSDMKQAWQQRIDLGLPRFEIDWQGELKPALQKLGLRTPWGSSANFSSLSRERLYMDGMQQKVRVKVDEQGTEASAVTMTTAIGCASNIEPEPPIDFWCDRPFLFAIVDNQTAAILVMGEYRGEANAPKMERAKHVARQAPAPLPSRLTTRPDMPDSPNRVFDVVEEMPRFADGGTEGLMEYLRKNTRYPAEARAKGLEGRVIVTFVVEKDGSITNAKVVKSVDECLNREALRVVSGMPKWIPGRMNGIPVRVKYCLPVTFRLDETVKPEQQTRHNGDVQVL